MYKNVAHKPGHQCEVVYPKIYIGKGYPSSGQSLSGQCRQASRLPGQASGGQLCVKSCLSANPGMPPECACLLKERVAKFKKECYFPSL